MSSKSDAGDVEICGCGKGVEEEEEGCEGEEREWIGKGLHD